MRPMPYKDPKMKKDYHNLYMREVWYPKNKSKHIGYQTEIKKKIITYPGMSYGFSSRNTVGRVYCQHPLN